MINTNKKDNEKSVLCKLKMISELKFDSKKYVR